MPSKKRKLGFRIANEEGEALEWLKPFQDMNQFSSLMRLLIYERIGIPIPDDLELLARAVGAPPIQTEIQALWGAVDEIRAELNDMRRKGSNPALLDEVVSRLDAIEQTVSELQGHQTIYADELPDGTPKPKLTGKQAVLSAKLKGINFGELAH